MHLVGGAARTHPPYTQHSKGRQTFTFDRVFNWDASQTEVFNYAARHVVDGTAASSLRGWCSHHR